VDAVDAVVRRDETLKKEVELERLRMAIRDNIVTPEVKADGYGPSTSRGSQNRSIRSGWCTPSRPSPRQTKFSTPRSCRPPTSAGRIEAVSGSHQLFVKFLPLASAGERNFSIVLQHDKFILQLQYRIDASASR
jgi:hypothetical protein